jgi:hypothetical protein
MLDNGLWVSLNLHLVEDFQLLLQNSLWSSLNQHSRTLPISRRHQLQLLANLGNVPGTIEPRAKLQRLWSSLNHQIGLWSFLKPPPLSSRRHQLLLAILFVVIPKPPDSESTFNHWQLSTSIFQLHTSDFTSYLGFTLLRIKGGNVANIIHLGLLEERIRKVTICERSLEVQETLEDESKGYPNVYIRVSYQLINALHVYPILCVQQLCSQIFNSSKYS